MSEENNETEEGVHEYGGSSTFEDMEAARNRPPRTNLNEIKVEDEDVDEDFRGKSVAEIIEQAKRLKKAVEISETARLALQNSQEALTSSRQAPPPAAPAAPAPEPELNDEQLQALFDESPRKYHEYLNQQSEKRILSTLKSQIAPVLGSSADLALRDAERRYPDEFAAFGKEMKEFISRMPDKSALAQEGAIDELVDWQRGKHWKKFDEYRQSKAGNGLNDARKQMAEETPSDFARTPQVTRQNGGGGRRVQLDQVQREVAAAMGLSEEQYAEGLTPSQRTRGRNA